MQNLEKHHKDLCDQCRSVCWELAKLNRLVASSHSIKVADHLERMIEHGRLDEMSSVLHDHWDALNQRGDVPYLDAMF